MVIEITRRVSFILFTICLGLLGTSGSTEAGGDWHKSDCYLKLENRDSEYTRCNSAIIAPGNDTRVNLILLSQNEMGKAPLSLKGQSIAKDFGNRFLNNNYFSSETFFIFMGEKNSTKGYQNWRYTVAHCAGLTGGDTDFYKALDANKDVFKEDKTKLIYARRELHKICDGKQVDDIQWPINISNSSGLSFLTYLQASAHFYSENWDQADKSFKKINNASDPWIREVTSYMIGRNKLKKTLNSALDKWGNFKGLGFIKQEPLLETNQAFISYLSRYPNGQYMSSARGLLRRLIWLSGDEEGLAKEYIRLLNSDKFPSAKKVNLVKEIDQKLLPLRDPLSKIDPVLLATNNLARMRSNRPTGYTSLSKTELMKQKEHFKDHMKLFTFLQATFAFYIDEDAQKVLSLIPDTSSQDNFSPLEFSRQALRGMALNILSDPGEEDFWKEMLGGANSFYQRPVVELALAQYYEKNAQLSKIFMKGSVINDSYIRKILLFKVASKKMLREQLKNIERPKHERDLALFVLLDKELSRGHYLDFVEDVKQVATNSSIDGYLWRVYSQYEIPVGKFNKGKWSDGYECPNIRTTALNLAYGPNNIKALLCLADFYRLNGFDGYHNASAPGPGGVDRFPGKAISRGSIYSNIIEGSLAKDEDMAYALYRAINCYAPVGNNSCGGSVSVTTRKAWFELLKGKYGNSKWAKRLKYYW